MLGCSRWLSMIPVGVAQWLTGWNVYCDHSAGKFSSLPRLAACWFLLPWSTDRAAQSAQVWANQSVQWQDTRMFTLSRPGYTVHRNVFIDSFLGIKWVISKCLVICCFLCDMWFVFLVILVRVILCGVLNVEMADMSLGHTLTNGLVWKM